MDNFNRINVIHRGALSMQVCAPHAATDEEIEATANVKNMCGTTIGWKVRKAGDKLLAGDAERVQCSINHEHVHVMLDC